MWRIIGNILGYIVFGLVLFGIAFLKRKLKEHKEEQEYHECFEIEKKESNKK